MKNGFIVFVSAVFLSGCMSHYGPKGLNGGYTDKRLDPTSYFIRYDSSPFAGVMADTAQLMGLWDKRAQELCGSEDFFKDSKVLRIDDSGRENALASPSVYGTVYCNNKFIDTRKQNHEENYFQYINLPKKLISFRDVSPLWGLLVSKKYRELHDELDKLQTVLNVRELAGVLETFSRINPEAELNFEEWINKYPDSFIARYARALYYHHLSWFKRGSGFWKDLTKEQKAGLFKYQKLARIDLDKSLELNFEFCPSHSLRLHVHTAVLETDGVVFENYFSEATSVCPESVPIYQAYLRNLLPRWGGSKVKMMNFIEVSKLKNEKFGVLEALYLAEEGDQLLYEDKIDQALKKYDKALEQGQFASIYQQRAEVLESLGRYIEASDAYQAAISLSPYYVAAYEGMTRMYLKTNNPIGALVASSYLTAMNNQDNKNFEIRGNIFYLVRRYEDALESYTHALELSSDNARLKHMIRMTEFQLSVRENDKSSLERDLAI